MRELTEGIAEQLNTTGLGDVNTWVDEKLEGIKAEFTDVSVAKQVEGLPEGVKQKVQKSYSLLPTHYSLLTTRRSPLTTPHSSLT